MSSYIDYLHAGRGCASLKSTSDPNFIPVIYPFRGHAPKVLTWHIGSLHARNHKLKLTMAF